MKSSFLILFLSISLTVPGQDLKSPFERSEGRLTGTYFEVIDFYKQLSASYPELKMIEVGQTDSGFPLHLVMFDTDREFDPAKAARDGKVILMINNGIHPGEPDGIEACMMWIRDVVKDRKKKREMENIFVGIIPLYNIGGALNRNSTSRANQNGPDEYGFRGNAQNRDLNRDFIKMDTRNANAFARIYHMLKPDVFIDTHVSNGADYQYSITHLATQPDKLGGPAGKYMQETMIPKLEANMLDLQAEIIPYVNAFGSTPDKGYGIFFDSPRYSTGYTTLFNTLGFMIETHMLKPFDQRVHASYAFFDAVCMIIREDGKQIMELHRKGDRFFRNSDSYTLTWDRNREISREITFKGYEGTMKESPFGGQRLFYDRDQPYERKIPYFDRFEPGIQVQIPAYYLIPQGWHEVTDRLRVNDIQMRPLDTDTTIRVEVYRVEEVEYSRGPYEGHFLHRDVGLAREIEDLTFRKGDLLVSTEQEGIRFLLETLEPEATDSYFKWNFFDAILQQKEGYSGYVFEDVAMELVENDPSLKEKLEAAQQADPELKGSRRVLDWIYRNSQYYEKSHMIYPVYRVMK